LRNPLLRLLWAQVINNFELGIVARPADVDWQAPFNEVVPYAPDEDPWLM